MTLITGEVYDYMLDDIQRSTMRSVSKMNDVITHLKLQPMPVITSEKYVEKAAAVQSLLKQAATLIDDLPALGADLEALAGSDQTQAEKKPGIIVQMSEAEAVEKVGRRMTRDAMMNAILDHIGGESISYDVIKDKYVIVMAEEN